METIWKYQFHVWDDFELEMPSGAEILSVQIQDNIPCLWAKVVDYAPKRIRHFQLFGTGHEMPLITQRRKYIGTFQLQQGPILVFHLFELLNW